MKQDETLKKDDLVQDPTTEEPVDEPAADPAEETEKDAAENAAPEETVEPSVEEKLEQEKAKAADMEDRWKRSMAEFDNFRKRTQKEKEQSFDRGARDVIEKMLPVLDNFERALAGTEGSEDPFVQGIAMIHQQYVGALKDLGVEEIEALGKPFDPNLHYAVSHVENEELGEGVVASVFQKGYRHKDAVIRCSMVQVAN